MLSDDQLARIRFAHRVWSTGNTFGAPADAVREAWNLIDDIAVEGTPTSREEFVQLAKEILRKSEN